MGVKIKNNAFGVLLISINTSATSITLQTGQGANFPSLGAGDYFYATLIDTSNNLEIVKVTARTGDVLTVVRAQEGTSARSYAVGDRIELRLTAQNILDMLADGSMIGAGTVPGTALADLAVATGKVADGAITAAKLATDAVETAKVKDGAITAAKIASGVLYTPNVYRVDSVLRSGIQSTSGSYTDDISAYLTSKTYAVILRLEYQHNGSNNHGYWTANFYQSGKNSLSKNILYFNRSHFDWYFNDFFVEHVIPWDIAGSPNLIAAVQTGYFTGANTYRYGIAGVLER
jgi:hypothetical protein